MAYGLWRMAYSVWFQLYAISYQLYANYARLASEIVLSSLKPSFSATCYMHCQ